MLKPSLDQNAIAGEINAVKDYVKKYGKDELSISESFLLHLSKVKSFQILIKVFLEQSIFPDKTAKIFAEFGAMDRALGTLKWSKSLQKFLQITLEIGNFMNGGQGGVLGFDLAFLTELADLKSCLPMQNMLHFILKKFTTEEILEFLEEAKDYSKASGIDPAMLISEVNELSIQLTDLQEQTEEAGISNFNEFFEIEIPNLADMKRKAEMLDETVKAVITFFYPGLKSGKSPRRKIQETFSSLANFGIQVEQVSRPIIFPKTF